MADTIVDEITWENFHRVVNMTSRELQAWLLVEGAGERTESLPDQAGPPLGHRVLEILGKRKADLTDDDVAVMRRVVDKVVGKRGEELDRPVDDDRDRRRLMDLGHDSLKPE
jgi:Protein of unknown function (DUF3140)